MSFEQDQAYHKTFIDLAIDLASNNVRSNCGGPFGAVVVKDGNVIATGVNRVVVAHDPTAHAEIEAIRLACRALASFQLEGCDIYSSCEPCPMCMGAIYWARPRAVYYAATQADATDAGFDDSFIYRDMALVPEARKIKMVHMLHQGAGASFELWRVANRKVLY
jgi:tRNA(Arg) A34 adenosine deaminase TadA